MVDLEAVRKLAAQSRAAGALPDPAEVERQRTEFQQLVNEFRQRHVVLQQEPLTEQQRREILARLERAQARRWVPAVRAAGEAVPNADAPAVTPDTVWSGDFQTLVELFHVSLYRVNMAAAYIAEIGGKHGCGPQLVGILNVPGMRIGG